MSLLAFQLSCWFPCACVCVCVCVCGRGEGGRRGGGGGGSREASGQEKPYLGKLGVLGNVEGLLSIAFKGSPNKGH